MPLPSQSSTPEKEQTLDSARSSLVDSLRARAQSFPAQTSEHPTTLPPIPTTEPAKTTPPTPAKDPATLPDVLIARADSVPAQARRIYVVGMAQRVDEAAGLKADQQINKRFEEYRQSSLTTSSGLLAKLGRLAIAPLRINTYKAAWLRMTADAKRAELLRDMSPAAFSEMATESERTAVLERIASLDGRSVARGDFGEQRINETRRGRRAEEALRALATKYVTGELSADTFEEQKAEIVGQAGVRHVVDNTRAVLDEIRGGRTLTTDEANAALKDISFAIWNDSSAAGEKLRRGFGDRLVAACHASRILGTVPGITASTAALVSIAVYLAKGGFGTRQLAIGVASGMGTSFALGAAIASAPVISGLIIGTAVASVFSYLRKGRELKKDLNQVRTEKVLGQHQPDDQELSRKDKLFRETFMNSKALNVKQRITDLTAITDPQALAQAIGETEAALALQNDPRTRANSLDYSDPSQVARERMELLRALANARRIHQGHAVDAETKKTLDAKREAAKATFLDHFTTTQHEVNQSFTSHRRVEQTKSLVTTLVAGGLMGGLFYGAGKAVDAVQEHWGQTSSGVAGATPAQSSTPTSLGSTSASATPGSPTIHEVVQHTVVKPPPIDLTQLPTGISLDPTGDIIVDSSAVDPQVLRDLQTYQPNFSTVQLQAGTPAHDSTRSITESLISTDATNGIRGGTLSREYYYDNGTTAFDKNELRLHWGGAGRRGLDGDGNIVYSVSKMFREDSYLFQHGSKVSLDVGDAVTNGAARTAQQGQVEMVLRLDANNPAEIIRIPIQPDGRVVIPDEVKEVAYRINAHGQAEYIGWKASIGLVTENSDGTISLGEIATDFGEKKLNGATVHETVAGSDPIYEYRFPKVEEIREEIVARVIPPPSVPPVDEVTPRPVTSEAPSSDREWIFPVGWDDHRDALGNRNKEKPDTQEKADTKEPTIPPPLVPGAPESVSSTTPPAGESAVVVAPQSEPTNVGATTPPSSDDSSSNKEVAEAAKTSPYDGLEWTKVTDTDDKKKKRDALESNLESIFRANPRKLVDPLSDLPWYTEEVQYYTGKTDAPDSGKVHDMQPGMAAILSNNKGELLGIVSVKNPKLRSSDDDETLLIVVDPLQDGPDNRYTSKRAIEKLVSDFGATSFEFVKNNEEHAVAPAEAQSNPSVEPAAQTTTPPPPPASLVVGSNASNAHASPNTHPAEPGPNDTRTPRVREIKVDQILRPEPPPRKPLSKRRSRYTGEQ